MQELSALLTKFGYKPDIDDWNEHLPSFTIDRSEEITRPEGLTPKYGFLKARPPAYNSLEDEAKAMVKALQTSIVKNRLERPLPAKTLRRLKKTLSKGKFLSAGRSPLILISIMN